MKFSIDQAGVEAKGLTYASAGDFVTITKPLPEGAPEDARPQKWRVAMSDGALLLFPERSSSQKELLGLLS